MIPKLFISYSHADLEALQSMSRFLEPMQRNLQIDSWDDRRIKASDDWQSEINNALESANAAILLLSQDFINSSFIASDELPRILSRHKDEGLEIFMVVLNKCQWDWNEDLKRIQAVNNPKNPWYGLDRIEAESVWLSLSERLRDLTSSSRGNSNDQSRIKFINFPRRGQFYVNRANEFDCINDLLSAKDEEIPILLSGLGGIGKTSLALEYCYSRRDSINHAIWISAETEADISASYAAVSRELNLDYSGAGISTFAQTLGEWISKHENSILVLDNLEPSTSHIFERLFSHRLEGTVIVTSRQNDLPVLGKCRRFEPSLLSIEEGIALLSERVDSQARARSSLTSMSNLVEVAGGFPLALELIASYVNTVGCSYDEYYALLSESKGRFPDDTHAFKNERFLKDAWGIILQRLELHSPTSAQILKMASLLSTENIPIELFIRELHNSDIVELDKFATSNLIEVAEILVPLRNYSLVSQGTKNNSFSVHSLVQRAVRTAMTETERLGIMQQVFSAMLHFLVIPESENWGVYERFSSHFDAILSWLVSEGQYEEASARMYQYLSFYFGDIGDQRQRVRCMELAMEVANQLPKSEENVDRLARILGSLASIRRDSDDFEGAKEAYESVLELMYASKPAVSTEIGVLQCNLGNTEKELGSYESSTSRLQIARNIQEELARSEDERLAKANRWNLTHTLVNLGDLNEVQGFYEVAEDFYTQAYKIRKEMKPNDPDSFLPLHCLGSIYLRTDRLSEARKAFLETIACRRHSMDRRSGAIGKSMSCLSRVLIGLEKSSLALGLAKKARAIIKDEKGVAHADYAQSTFNLGLAYLSSDFEKGIDYLLESLVVRRRCFAKHSAHHEVAESEIALGKAYLAINQKRRAKDFLARGLAILKVVRCEGHAEILEVEHLLKSLEPG